MRRLLLLLAATRIVAQTPEPDPYTRAVATWITIEVVFRLI